MANLHLSPHSAEGTSSIIFGRRRITCLLVSLALLCLCLAFSWITRDSMAHLPFLKGKGAAGNAAGQKSLVDLGPWQTAQALAPLAVTAEENAYALQAEQLADHEVDQAFATALRKASAQVQRRVLTGDALALSQKVAQMKLVVQQDQALVHSLGGSTSDDKTAAPKSDEADKDAASSTGNDDLDIAQAQLSLDSDVLDDAQENLARALGDNRTQIQAELTEHESAMREFDKSSHSGGEVAVVSVSHHGTLAARIQAWKNQRERKQLIQQALVQAQSDVNTLTSERNALAAETNGAANAGQPSADAATDHSVQLASLKEKGAERQLLSIYADRIQTEQQLAKVYSAWGAQVQLQHRILVHLTLQSLAWIAFIILCIILCDALVEKLLRHPSLDRRQMQTLRTVFKLGVQLTGGLVILLIVFGTPNQMPTILGLATAGITIVMQDFILAFFGWFVLMGKNGIRIGDWVEINGVGGEVTEIGIIRTTLLEMGDWTDLGHQTGRRVSFLNSFAIRGQYFNFSTTGQWMWDEISVSLPASANTSAMVERIHTAMLEETSESARIAETEWKRGTRQNGLSNFSASPTVNLRPSGAGIDILVRYVTRAAQRFEMRNRLYQRVIDLLNQPTAATLPAGEELVQDK
jgi:small-conductance mechanosensitive channel